MIEQETPIAAECDDRETRHDRLYIYMALLAIGVIGAYWRSMQWVANLSLMHVDTGGGLFAPLVSAYLVWSQRDQLQGLRPTRTHWGALALALGLLLFTAGLWGRFTSLLTVSLVVVVWGVVTSMGGLELGRRLAFPIAYLGFLSPAPTVLDNLSVPLRRLATVIAGILPRALGLDTRIDGTELIVDGFRTMIDAPCSGLSYVLVLFACSTLIAYMSECSNARRVLYGLSAIPIALFANVLRIQMTFLLPSVFGDLFSAGAGHFMVGVVVFIFSVLSLLGLWSLICQEWTDAS